MSHLTRIALLLLPLFLAATEALACPACAMRENNGYGNFLIMAGLIFSPFMVCGSVVLILRRLAPPAEESVPSSSSDGRGF